MDKTRYCNELLYRLEALFFHELSDCASWKTEMVGTDFIQAQGIEGRTEDEVIRGCIERIKAAGIAQDIRYSISGRGILLKLAIRGCQHLDKERMLREAGVRPYNCVIANMICDRLIEKLGYTTTYVAQLDVRETAQACALKVAIYATPEMIGRVSDWSKESDEAAAPQTEEAAVRA